MHDDWSYIWTAKILAESGHVVFNGWGAPMLGIQLLPAALLIKLFGFSFTTARLTTVGVGMLTAALLQRTMVRCGIREFAAFVGTLTFLLSPVCLPTIASFISDLWSVFAIIVCLYCCLRTLAASDDKRAAGWICAATLGNAILGTSRQIAWLGLLVMVPSTLLLVGRRTKVLLAAIVSLAIGCVSVAVSLAWLAHHPYTLPEHLDFSAWREARHHPDILVRPFLDIWMLTLPVLAMFLPALSRTTRGSRVLAAASLFAFALWAHHGHSLHTYALPFVRQHGSLFSPKGVYFDWPIWGTRPRATPDWMRAGAAVFVFAGIVCWIAVTFGGHSNRELSRPTRTLSRVQLLVLLMPFGIAYTLFLLPRAFRDATIDRYVLPLVLISLILLLRQYQSHIGALLPRAALVLSLLVATYSVATLQDAFGAYRAVEAAGRELVAAGIPRSHFDGGWEYDGLTQILEGGYVHQSYIRTPGNVPLLFGHRRTGPCEIPINAWIPSVTPEYALSYDQEGCGGATAFAPVTYWRLLWPHRITLYVVKDPDLSEKHGPFASF